MATTPPFIETIETTTRRVLPARRVLRRAAWLVADLAATAGFAVFALHALT